MSKSMWSLFFILLFNSAFVLSQDSLLEHQEYGLKKSSVDFIYSSCYLRPKLYTACIEAIYQTSNSFGTSHSILVSRNRVYLTASRDHFKTLNVEKMKMVTRASLSTTFFYSHNQRVLKVSIDKLLNSLYHDILKPSEHGYANKLLLEELKKNQDNPHYGLSLSSPFNSIKKEYISGIRLISRFGQSFIFDILEGSAAFKAGLKPGDRIISLNGLDIQYLHNELWSDGLSSTDKEILSLKTERKGIYSKHLLHLSRVVPRRYSFSFDNFKASIHFYSFTKGICSKVKSDLLKTKYKNPKFDLTIDLRNNYGGDVEEMLCLVDLFLDKNIKVGSLIQNEDIIEVYKTNKNKLFLGKLKILVNARTASSSEIFTSIMSELNRATVYGQRTYGKFSVGYLGLQYDFEELGSQMLGFEKIGEFVLPSGKCFEGLGFNPLFKIDENNGLRISDLYF